MVRSCGMLVLLMIVFHMGGCATQFAYELRMARKEAITAEIVASPALKERQYRKVMVVPPSWIHLPMFECQIFNIEKAFLKQGLSVVSPEVTFRAIFDKEIKKPFQEKKVEGNAVEHNHTDTKSPVNKEKTGKDVVQPNQLELSTVERALLFVEEKESSVQAIFQVVELEWVSGGSRRYFISSGEKDKKLIEVSENTYSETSPNRFRYQLWAPLLRLTGRLIDAKDGQVLASLSMQGAVADHIPTEYLTEVLEDGIRDKENYKWNGDWIEKAQAELVSILFSKVADIITE